MFGNIRNDGYWLEIKKVLMWAYFYYYYDLCKSWIYDVIW